MSLCYVSACNNFFKEFFVDSLISWREQKKRIICYSTIVSSLKSYKKKKGFKLSKIQKYIIRLNISFKFSIIWAKLVITIVIVILIIVFITWIMSRPLINYNNSNNGNYNFNNVKTIRAQTINFQILVTWYIWTNQNLSFSISIPSVSSIRVFM